MSRKLRRASAARKSAPPSKAPAEQNPETATEALFSQGVALHQSGQSAAALQIYRAVLVQKPDHIKALNNIGIALRQLGRMQEAIPFYQRVAALDPAFPDTYYNLGIALQKQGRMAEAAPLYRRCTQLKPDHAPAWSNCGVVVSAVGQLEQGIGLYRQAIAVRRDYWEAYINLGGALERVGRLSEAEDALRQALRLNPRSPELLSNLGNVLKSRGLMDAAEAAYNQGLAFDPHYVAIACNRLFAMNYHGELAAETVAAAHRQWAERFEAPICAAHPFNPAIFSRDPHRRLRIGYVSPDLKTHSVAHFLEPVLAHHDRRQFAVFCYAEVTEPDAVTARLQSFTDGWRSSVALSDAQVAAQIRQDQIDILVDLAGHTGNNRLTLFAYRPAPVQVTWLGYPNTTGLRSIQYRITDAIADPLGITDPWHSETLVRLPQGFLCYRPPSGTGEPAPPPARQNGYVTFGSFNNLSKITPEVIRVWAALLHRVPDSRLLLKSTALTDPPTAQRIRDLFATHAIPPQRLELVGRIAGQVGHLAAYSRMDIALDTFPYNGTTTTCEALWMGVPVVTLTGDRHAARVGTSLVHRIGLPGLAAADPEAYIQLAAGLAGVPAQREELRQTLRPRMQASPLRDEAGFARILEQAYREFWHRWRQGA